MSLVGLQVRQFVDISRCPSRAALRSRNPVWFIKKFRPPVVFFRRQQSSQGTVQGRPIGWCLRRTHNCSHPNPIYESPPQCAGHFSHAPINSSQCRAASCPARRATRRRFAVWGSYQGFGVTRLFFAAYVRSSDITDGMFDLKRGLALTGLVARISRGGFTAPPPSIDPA